MQGLVSVVVPIYNVQEYIERCVKSIMQQSYYNIEILLIDDGSTDNSGVLADEYAATDNRIKVFHKKNGGLSDARNYGLAMSTGEYICFIDSDDFIHRDYVECLMSICRKQECDIAQCNFVRTDGKIDIDLHAGKDASIQIYNNIEMLNNLYGEQYINTVIVCNKLYNKKLFHDIEFPINRIHEDEATTYKLIYKANRIGVIESELYFYFQRTNSIMQKKYNIKRLDILWAIEQRRTFFNEKGLRDLYYKDNYKMLTKILKNYYEVVHAKDINNRHTILDELKKKYEDVIIESKHAKWSRKRWLMLKVFRYIPRLYVPIINFKMLIDKKTNN